MGRNDEFKAGRVNAQSDLLEVRVAFDEFLGAAAGEGDGEAAIVFVAFNADDGAHAVFGVANFLADQRIGASTTADGAAEAEFAARTLRLRLANRGSVA